MFKIFFKTFKSSILLRFQNLESAIKWIRENQVFMYFPKKYVIEKQINVPVKYAWNIQNVDGDSFWNKWEIFYFFGICVIFHFCWLSKTCFIGRSTLVGQRPMKSLSWSVPLSVRPSLSFPKIGSLVFSNIVLYHSWL